MHGARIENQRLALGMLLSTMRVAVADQIVLTAARRFAETSQVVAMEKRNPSSGEFQFSESLVALVSGGDDGLAQFGFVAVDIAEHIMRRPGPEQFDDRRTADIAAMNHHDRRKTFQHPHRAERVIELSVRIAHYAQQHTDFPLGRIWHKSTML